MNAWPNRALCTLSGKERDCSVQRKRLQWERVPWETNEGRRNSYDDGGGGGHNDGDGQTDEVRIQN